MARSLSRWTRHNQFWRFYRVSRLLFTTLWIMTHERNRVMRAQAHGRYDVLPDVEALRRVLRAFRTTAVELGGLLIKLGQFLSARADLLPAEALAELAALQDEVPAEDFTAIERALTRELGVPLNQRFSYVDPVPSGSASLGQVHRARLINGREVAIKVQRPGIERIVRTDLATIRFVLSVVRRVAPFADQLMDLHALYGEFSRMIYAELDYQHEGRNAERFARLVADEADIVIPAVLWGMTTRRVLTLEWVDGIKITHFEELARAGVDRGALAHRLTDTYFRQVLQLGFFHADPHPGNIFVQPQPHGFNLVFVDFGMMGHITAPLKAGLRDCFSGIVWRDSSLITRGLTALGFIGESANHLALEQAVDLLLERYSDLPFSELQHLDPRETLSELEGLLYGQPLRLPAHFAFLGRAAAMLVGLAAALSPDFNVVTAITPYAERLARGSTVDGMLHLIGVESMSQLGRVLTREGVAMARTIATLPHLTERVLARVEHGDLRLIIEGLEPNSRLTNQMRRRVVTNALWRPVPAWVPLSLVGAATVALVVRRRRNGA